MNAEILTYGDWKKAKDAYINQYFSEDARMREVAEDAFRGTWQKQEELAELFESKGYLDPARVWREKSKFAKKEKGIED